MSEGDTARTNYVSVRAEIQARIQLRDNVLVLYLGAVSAILGIAVGTQITKEILLIIPFLAIGATAIITQHHAMIGKLGAFLRRELEPFLKEIGEYAPQWDTSKTFRDSPSGSPFMGLRFGYIWLIGGPAIAALIINWQNSIYLPLSGLVMWWIGATLTVISVWTILETGKLRKRLGG